MKKRGELFRLRFTNGALSLTTSDAIPREPNTSSRVTLTQAVLFHKALQTAGGSRRFQAIGRILEGFY
jgi:hypothetical protein